MPGVDTLERMVKEDIPEEITPDQDQAEELASATAGAGVSLVCWNKRVSVTEVKWIGRKW